MQIANPLQMNDWEIKKFFIIVLSIQLALLGLMGMDVTGIDIPILRQLIGFIYLGFVPGILVLRILKIHTLSNIEVLLYSVGLSVSILMIIGLFINIAYPFLGFSGPISVISLILTISIIVLVLCLLSYILDRDFSNPNYINIKDIFSPQVLFLCLVLFLSIFGAHLANIHNNTLLILLIPLLPLAIVLTVFNKFISKNLYPFAVFVIAISLLYHISLISMYIIGWDIHEEYYLSSLVLKYSFWDSKIPSTVNGMLSIVMLAPIFSNICDMSLTWVFKIIYPLLFSLVPLGLYQIYQKQMNEKAALLSVFFLMSFSRFYYPMPRQNIAEFYIVLLILLMVDKNIARTKRSVLSIAFCISLAVSHYGTSYIYMFCLITAWLILILANRPAILNLGNSILLKVSKFSYNSDEIVSNPNSLIDYRTISSSFVLVFVVFTIGWYIYVSSSSAFNIIVGVFDHIVSSIFTSFLNPEAAQGLAIITAKPESPLRGIMKSLSLITLFFISAGIFTLLINQKKLMFKREYCAFSYVNFAICIGGIVLPYFASAFNTDRLYHLTLIILAPFCVLGGMAVFRSLSRASKISWTYKCEENSLKMLSVFLAVFMIFSSGWCFEVANDGIPQAMALNSTMDYWRFNDQEVIGARWLDRMDVNKPIYADYYRQLVLNELKSRQATPFSSDFSKLSKYSYIYFGTLNVLKEEVLVQYFEGTISKASYMNPKEAICSRNSIYANGGAEVYY